MPDGSSPAKDQPEQRGSLALVGSGALLAAVLAIALLSAWAGSAIAVAARVAGLLLSLRRGGAPR